MLMSQDSKKIALITGASYGVGAATARLFAKNNYHVCLTATNIKNLNNISQELSELKFSLHELNLNSQKNIEDIYAEIKEQTGIINVLINNAATHKRIPAIEIKRDDWQEILQTNLDGTFFMSQAFAKQIIAHDAKSGSIVNITSTHSIASQANRSMYGISKAAINHMTRMLAVEWADHNIRVNGIAPGRMLTEAPSRQKTGNDKNYINNMLSKIPLNRLATPEEVAASALFLSSKDANSITGQTLIIDGGLTLK
jgi:NAD(P)-dependent dehydrogenase (short-subunit alcohol dehydrogenase family)|tara:strand:+ start:1323 stop:2087 length:765 start_codon:yes stop_codon:yes gene_type:complete